MDAKWLVRDDGSLRSMEEYVLWELDGDTVELDGHFTVEKLDFIVAHIRAERLKHTARPENVSCANCIRWDEFEFPRGRGNCRIDTPPTKITTSGWSCVDWRARASEEEHNGER